MLTWVLAAAWLASGVQPGNSTRVYVHAAAAACTSAQASSDDSHSSRTVHAQGTEQLPGTQPQQQALLQQREHVALPVHEQGIFHHLPSTRSGRHLLQHSALDSGPDAPGASGAQQQGDAASAKAEKAAAALQEEPPTRMRPGTPAGGSAAASLAGGSVEGTSTPPPPPPLPVPAFGPAEPSGFSFDGFGFGFGGLAASTPNQVDNLIINSIFNRCS